tara:strand:- start:753 stop:1301 length:549 start_codon:yes stop_codon:yes gene_type:complete
VITALDRLAVRAPLIYHTVIGEAEGMARLHADSCLKQAVLDYCFMDDVSNDVAVKALEVQLGRNEAALRYHRSEQLERVKAIREEHPDVFSLYLRAMEEAQNLLSERVQTEITRLAMKNDTMLSLVPTSKEQICNHAQQIAQSDAMLQPVPAPHYFADRLQQERENRALGLAANENRLGHYF